MYKEINYKDIAEFLDDKSKKAMLKTSLFIDPNNTNSRAIAGSTPFTLLRPHNLRRQIDVECIRNSPIYTRLLAIKEAKKNEHTKAITITKYKGSQVTIQVNKKTITAMWVQRKKGSKKETYKVQGNAKTVWAFMHLKMHEIQHELDFYLNTILDGYAIKSHAETLHWSQRDFYMRQSSAKLNLPRDSIIDAGDVYKSYQEGYEKRIDGDDESDIVRHITNNTLIDLEPELVAEMEKIYDKLTDLKKYNNVLRFLKQNIKRAVDLLKFPKLVEQLNDYEKLELSNYTFELENGLKQTLSI